MMLRPVQIYGCVHKKNRNKGKILFTFISNMFFDFYFNLFSMTFLVKEFHSQTTNEFILKMLEICIKNIISLFLKLNN